MIEGEGRKKETKYAADKPSTYIHDTVNIDLYFKR
jgi:hypothetical protein